jgi:hypothetical protein
MASSLPPRARDTLLSCFWAICLLVSIGYLTYDNMAPPNPAAGYRTDVPIGWDLRITCEASRAYVAGRDPYHVENFEDKSITLPYIYPPFFLDFFAPVCTNAHPLDKIFRIAYPLAAVTAALLLVNWRAKGRARIQSFLVTMTVVIAGFSGFLWTLRTGNAALFIGLFLAIGMFFTRLGISSGGRDGGFNRYDIIGATIVGLALSIKFIYAPLLVALALLPKTWKSKIVLMAVASVGLLAPLLLSVTVYSHVFPSFLDSLLGRIPGQYAPSREACNPSLYCLTRDVTTRRLHITSNAALIFLNVIVIGAVLTLFGRAVFRILKPNLPDGKFTVGNVDGFLIANSVLAYRLTFFAMFTIMMLMERVKEYGYFAAAILIAPMIAELPFAASLVVGAGGVLLPMVTNEPRLAWHSPFNNYDQVIAAGISYVVVLFYLRMQAPRNVAMANPLALSRPAIAAES